MEALEQPYEVIGVDDGSRDGTWRPWSGQPQPTRELRVLRFRRNFGQTAAMQRASRRLAATSSSPWTATSRTTRPTSPVSLQRLEGRTAGQPTEPLRRGLRLAPEPPGQGVRPQAPLAHRQPPHQLHLRRPPPRLRLLAQGLPPRGPPGREALRRDAPLHPHLRELARRARHRAGRQPPRPARRQVSKYGLGRTGKVHARPDRGEVPRQLHHQAHLPLRRLRPPLAARLAFVAFAAALVFKLFGAKDLVQTPAPPPRRALRAGGHPEPAHGPARRARWCAPTTSPRASAPTHRPRSSTPLGLRRRPWTGAPGPSGAPPGPFQPSSPPRVSPTMCGIAGEVRFDARPDAAAVRAHGGRALAPRPRRRRASSPRARPRFGHRRLSILDLEGGVQPMTREGVTLVFNGQAYEHEALRGELTGRGPPLHHPVDTEVVLRAYLEWGEDFAERLHGMFAIALWDAPRQRLVLGRATGSARSRSTTPSAHGGRWLRSFPWPGGAPAARGPHSSSAPSSRRSSRTAACPRTHRPRAALVQYLAVEYVPAPRSILRRACASCPRRTSPCSTRRASASAATGSSRAPARARADAREAAAELLAPARRRRGPAPRGRRPGGRLPQRRRRLHRPSPRWRSATTAGSTSFSIGFAEASFDESAYAAPRRARARHGPPHRGALRIGLRRPAPRGRRPPRRALRGPEHPAHAPALALRPAAREGGARRRRRRRALRRVRPLPRPPPGGRASRGCPRAARALWLGAVRPPPRLRHQHEPRLPAQAARPRPRRRPPALRHATWIGSFVPAELARCSPRTSARSPREAVVYREILAEAAREAPRGARPRAASTRRCAST